MLVTRPPIDRHWLEDELDELERLVEAGETLELIGRLDPIVAAPRGTATGERAGAAEATPASEIGLALRATRPGSRSSRSWPPSRLFVKSGCRRDRCRLRASFSIPERAPGRRPGTRPGRRPPTRRRCRSTPRRRGCRQRLAPSTSVGPSSADWSTLATTLSGSRCTRSYRQSRAVVAVGSVEPTGNCWLEPGSSVMSRLRRRRLDVVRLVDLVRRS